jgi:hypothetical protein
MNKTIKPLKTLAYMMAMNTVLNESLEASKSEKQQKERTIRKCADPKKKAKRKMRQESQRRNR